MPFRTVPILTVLLALTCLAVAVDVVLSWWCLGSVNHVAGVWTACALDLVEGVFYRPLVGPEGYGGTRYMPLFFVLQAGLIRLGLEPVIAGLVLSLSAMGLTCGGAWVLFRRLGGGRLMAGLALAALLSTSAGRWALTSIRADGLALGLAVWGAALALGPGRDRRWWLIVAVLLALSWSAKLTSLWAPAGLLAWLAVSGRRYPAIRLGLWTGLGLAIVAGLTIALSCGRVIEIFRVCAPGGASPGGIAAGPLIMFRTALDQDPAGLAVILAGLAAAVMLVVFRRAGAETWLFAAGLGATVFIFGSPGTDFNHLLTAELTALGCLVAWAGAADSKRGPFLSGSRAALALTSLCCLIGLGGAVHDVINAGTSRSLTIRPYRAAYARAAGFLAQRPGPILAENSMVPVMAGQRPQVLDCFMLNLIRARRPGSLDPLLKAVAGGGFAALVFNRPGPEEGGLARLERDQFGKRLWPLAGRAYTKAWSNDLWVIYIPRGDG